MNEKAASGCSPAALRNLAVPTADVCSPQAASKLTGVASSTIHKWVAQGRIAAVEAGTARYPNAIAVSAAAVAEERDYRASVVSARRTAHIIGVAVTTVVYYCERGYLDCHRRGKLYEIELAAIEDFVRRHSAGEVCARYRLPQPGLVTCELPTCTTAFRPNARNWRRGYGRFCSHGHYAEDLRRRCREGTLVLPLMTELPRARQRWMGRWSGKRGGRPQGDLDPELVSQVRALQTAGWGRGAIAKRLGVTEHRVRLALALGEGFSPANSA